MGRRYRGFLTLVAFLVLSAVSLATAFVALVTRLPDPEVADTETLLRWLSTRDLAEQPPQIQQRFLYRVEAELRRGFDGGAVLSKLDPSNRAMLERNVDLLARTALRQRVEAYFDLPEDKRPAYLDQQINEISNWAAAQQLFYRDSTRKSQDSIATMLKHFKEWIESAPAQEQARMTQFVAAVQRRIWEHRLQSLLRSPFDRMTRDKLNRDE